RPDIPSFPTRRSSDLLDAALLSLSGGGALYLNANRLRMELPGYRTLDLVGIPFRDSVITLDRDSAIPREMVRIAGGELDVFFPRSEEHTSELQSLAYL